MGVCEVSKLMPKLLFLGGDERNGCGRNEDKKSGKDKEKADGTDNQLFI